MNWVRTLFFLGMIAIPSSGMAGLSFLGELSDELSFYLFMPAIVLMFVKALPAMGKNVGHGLALGDVKALNNVIFIMCGIIALSALVNGYSIIDGTFRGRHAYEKFCSTLGVLGYGFVLSYLTYFVTMGSDWRDLIIKPIAISVVICGAYSLFEVASRNYGMLNGVYHFLESILHSGINSRGWILGWDTRIRSLAFEPPALGDYIGFAWPWMFFAYASSRGNLRIAYFALWMLLNILLWLSGARTALVMLAGSIVVLLFLRLAFLPPHPKVNFRRINHIAEGMLVLMGIAAIGLYFASYDKIRTAVIHSQDISNISRLSSVEAGFNIFMDHPLFGVGFGQYGFYLAKYLPYWGHYSPELTLALTDPKGPWPAAYMVYARFAGELGIFGLLMWPAIWISLSHQIARKTFDHFYVSGVMLPEAYPLIVSNFCVLFSGVTTDTLRTPMIWVNLGLTCRYLNDIRVNIQMAQLQAAQAQSLMKQSGAVDAPINQKTNVLPG